MLAQRPFLYEHQLTFHFYQNKHLSCSCKVYIEVTTIDLWQHPHMSSQHNKNMTTSHSHIFLHILIIYTLHSSFVYV